MQDGMMLPFIPENERFRRVRKLVTTEMRPSVSLRVPTSLRYTDRIIFEQSLKEHFCPIQIPEAHRLVVVSANKKRITK